MERYTFVSDGYPAVKSDVCYEDQNEDYCGDAIDRLAAYEDTGLEPEEISFCLNGIITAEEAKAHYNEAKKQHDEWFAWKQAESEGRLVVLPCKVGDAVYTAQRGVISELSVDHLELYNVGIWVGWHLMSGLYGNFRMDGFPASDIGKAVFLTREEAEDALKQEVAGEERAGGSQKSKVVSGPTDR